MELSLWKPHTFNDYDDVFLPIDQSAYFVADQEGGVTGIAGGKGAGGQGVDQITAEAVIEGTKASVSCLTHLPTPRESA